MRRLALLAALLIGCTASTPAAVSPSPTTTVTSSPTATPKPTPARARSVALVGSTIVVTGDFRGTGSSQVATLNDPTTDLSLRIGVKDQPADATDAVWMKSDPNFLSLQRAKFAVADVDADGKDDLVALYDSGGDTAKLFVFRSTGSAFVFAGPWWTGSEFTWSRARNIFGGRFSTGRDGLLVTYEDDGARTRFLAFDSTGTAFTLAGTVYDSGPGKLDLRKARFVAGRFAGSAAPDELAALYQTGTKAHVLLFEPASAATGTTQPAGARAYSMRGDLYTTDVDYDLARATVTAADVNGDGRDDLLSLYVGDDGSARVHVFDAAAGFAPANAFSGWASLAAGAVCAGPGSLVTGDWDRDGRADAAVLAPAAAGALRPHVLTSTGSAFSAVSGAQGLSCPVWPLNGLPLGFGDATKRPVYVKIDNNPHARPHYGISKADMVYEWLVEGLTTRLAAVFQSRQPDTIGGVRSVRMTDRPLLPSMGAVLVYSGGGPEELMAINYDASVAKRYIDLSPNYGWGYRVGFREGPYNYFTSWSAVQSAIAAAPDGTQPATVTPWSFLPTADGDPKAGGFAGSVSATTITIPYRELFGVSYQYDAASRTYARFDDGVREVDAANNQVIAAKNIVVIQTEVHFTTQYGLDPAGNPKLEEVLTGSGKGSVFRDGLRQDVTWTRNDIVDVFTLKDASGNVVQLEPGQTWIHVVPNDWSIPSR